MSMRWRATESGLVIRMGRLLDRLGLGVVHRARNWAALARRRQWEEKAWIASNAVLHPTAHLSNLREVRAIRIGEHTHVRGELLVLPHGGRIEIGAWGYVGEGTRIWSGCSVEIGDRVLVAHDCEIHDWNAHPIEAAARHEHFRAIVTTGHPLRLDSVPSAPIRLHDDVWIGFGSTILKGVTIHPRSIVAAGSMVVEDVPKDSLVAGRPARIIRRLVEGT